MNARTATRMARCLLVATFATGATGCTTLRGLLSTPPVTPTETVNPYAPIDPPVPGGMVIAASGQTNPPTGDGPPQYLPTPRPLPPGTPNTVTPPPGWPPGVPLPPEMQPQQPQGQPGQTGQTPYPMMQLPNPPPGHKQGAGDPHLRISPTVTGGRLNLAPYEVPTDRVVELSKQLELALAQNSVLLARIKELEALGLGREQALTEAVREIDAATTAGAKERGELQGRILGLQAKIKQMEEEDIIFLRAVIEALSKLLPPEKK